MEKGFLRKPNDEENERAITANALKLERVERKVE